MILTCPECTTSYEAPTELLGSTGRKVKCHKCSHIWLAIPDENVEAPREIFEIDDTDESLLDGEGDEGSNDIDLDDLIARSSEPADEAEADEAEVNEAEADKAEADEAEANEAEANEAVSTESADSSELEMMVGDETPDFDNEAEPEEESEVIDSSSDDPDHIEDVESIAAARRSLNQTFSGNLKFPVAKIRQIGMIAAALVLLLGGLYAFRYQVVSVAPGSSRLYALFGLDINLRGLEFREIVYAREFEDGVPVLAVRGEIINVTDAPVLLPTIRFSLRDSGAQEVYHWTGSAGPDLLAPSGVVPFESRLASPPVGAQEILVRFAGR